MADASKVKSKHVLMVDRNPSDLFWAAPTPSRCPSHARWHSLSGRLAAWQPWLRNRPVRAWFVRIPVSLSTEIYNAKRLRARSLLGGA